MASQEIKHGTEWAWRRCRELNGGVACDACRKAKNTAQKRQRHARYQRGIPEGAEHGLATYNHYGCHCKICVAAARERNTKNKRAWRARRKEAS